MSSEEPARSRTVLLVLACVGLAGAAVATTMLYRSNRAFRRQVSELVVEVEDLTKRLGRAVAENEALRDENDKQHQVLEAERTGREAAEGRATAAERRASNAEQDAKRAREEAAREHELRLAAEARAEQETRRADEELSRREAAERENERLREAERKASEHNLGSALADLARLENEMPLHAELEDESRRRAYLGYDCSVLQRLAYDFRLGTNDGEAARRRRDELESRFVDECDEVR